MKKNNNNIKKASYGALVAGCLLLAACGGEEEQAQSSAETISGSVFASSVSGATCEVLDGGGGVLGTVVVTAADGTFQVSVPGGTLQNEFSVNCSGGTFRDEATGTSGVQAGTLS
ncbi:MAG: hypothetical protein OEZ59_12325, partial [Deltaproteobacteria bacterium]|nr:hypothetical protein [Deltaproteobacteria bacterium]